MSKKKAAVLALAAIAVAVIVIGAVAKNKKGAADLPTVSWTTAEEKTLRETVSGSGTFAARRSSTVLSRVTGRVRDVAVADGQAVESGAVLVRLDDESYRNALEQAQVAYETALRQTQGQYLDIRQAFVEARDAAARAADLAERTKALFDVGSVSRDDLNRAEDASQSAARALESARQRANLSLGLPLDADPPDDGAAYEDAVDSSPAVRGARLAVQAAREQLSYCTVTAPEAGSVTGLSLNPGDLVTPQQPLCRVESLDDMIAQIVIDEVDIGKIAVGEAVSVTSDSLVGVTLNGRISSISPVVERIGNVRASQVKASVDPGGRFLRAGASCLVRIDVVSPEAELVIPVTAFFSGSGALWAYRILEETGEDGAVRNVLAKTEVELGRSSLDEVVVTSGLSPGDRVVTGDMSALRDGLAVTLAEDAGSAP